MRCIAPTSLPLLLVAAAAVAVIHSVMPDHWVPLALVARTSRWSIARTARISLFAAGGHVIASIVLGLLVTAAGLALRRDLISQEGHIVGGVLVITGLAFLGWAVVAGRSRGHHHHPHPGQLAAADGHTHTDVPIAVGQAARRPAPARLRRFASLKAQGRTLRVAGKLSKPRRASRAQGMPTGPRRGVLAGIIVPFGVAASPDLTILPVFFAASAVSLFAAILVLVVFSLATLATFVGLTVAATIGGYQVEWPWLEQNGHVVSAVVLVAIGIFAYVQF